MVVKQPKLNNFASDFLIKVKPFTCRKKKLTRTSDILPVHYAAAVAVTRSSRARRSGPAGPGTVTRNLDVWTILHRTGIKKKGKQLQTTAPISTRKFREKDFIPQLARITSAHEGAVNVLTSRVTDTLTDTTVTVDVPYRIRPGRSGPSSGPADWRQCTTSRPQPGRTGA
jgi:hypothetical protein